MTDASIGEAYLIRRSALTRLVDGLSLGMGWLSAALILAMLAMMCFEVAMRYLFNSPTIWVTEIATYVLVATAFLGLSYTHRKGGHIRVEFLITALKGDHACTLCLIAAWLGLLFVAFAAWQAVLMTWGNHVNGTRIFSLLYTPIYLPQIPLTIGLVGFALALLSEIASQAESAGAARRQLIRWLVPAALSGLVVCLYLLGQWPPAPWDGPFDWGAITIAATIVLLALAWTGWQVACGVFGAVAVAGIMLWMGRGGDVGTVVAIQVFLIIGFLLLGIRIALALGLVGLLSIFFLLPSPAPITLAERSWSSINSFTLTAVPMFVLMGSLLLRSGLSDQVFDALMKWLGRVPGGLAHAGVGACTIFAAVSGSSLATAATMGLVACPEMLKRGYNPKLAFGCIAAGGTLGILIPPSVAMIIYGSTVGAPVATLFIAGIIPGLLLALAFMGVIFVWGLLETSAAPTGDRYSWSARMRALLKILPVVLLIGAVLGTLYAGIATPTEAGAMGAGAALLICIIRRKLDVASLITILLETVKVTSFLFVIVAGASILTYSFDYLRLPRILVEIVTDADLQPWVVLLAIAIIYIVLGMFIDSISMMVMTLPVIFPMVVAMGFDPIWFGVVIVILMEIGLITPPVGMNLFALKGIGNHDSMTDIIHGALPFAVIMFLFVFLLYLVPELATWLPQSMN